MPRPGSDSPPGVPFDPRGGRQGWGAALALALVWGALAADPTPTGGSSEPPPVSPLSGRVAAHGDQVAQFQVSRTGRYAVTVTSPQGTALQLVDRAAGPLEVRGEAGRTDGRFDALLEAGEYRVRLRGDEKAEGEVRWEVHPFVETGGEIPVLEEARTLRSELGDLQQRSYALEVTRPGVLFLEAAGRHLADLRLWRDGTWLVDARPELGRSEPQSGRPLTWCRLQVRLEPGRYRVIAYGGPGEPWSDQAPERPLMVRLGLPQRSLAGRSRLRIGESGVERWLVPGRANYFRLELPSNPNQGETRLSLWGYDPNTPGLSDPATAVINKESRLPVAELERAESRPFTLVEVRGAAGQPYTLQHFEGRDRYDLPPGRYWLSTLHAGSAADRIDAAALLVRHGPQRDEFVADRAVELNARQGWSRRFNLLDPTSLFLHVSAAGAYRLAAEGVAARFRLEPFFSTPPAEFRHPDPVDAGHVWTLDPGYYVLDILPQPSGRGVIQVTLGPDGGGTPAATLSLPPASPSARFGELEIAPRDSLSLYLNRIPGVRHGLVLRELPVDLTQGLPVDLLPGEAIAIPVTLPEAGRIQALGEDGAAVPLMADHQGWQASAELAAGAHRVFLRAEPASPAGLDLNFTPRRLVPASRPRAFQAWDLTPEPPRLLAGQPQFLDLGRQRSASFSLPVTEPGLYRLESTGLLQTAGTLATPTRPQLARAQANGPGRNALIQHYLGAGAYQFTLTAQGQSAGRVGVQLTQAPLLEGGPLDLGNPARATLPAGQALAFHLRVEQAGDYRLHAQGLRGDFAVRLEDADGWPVVTPNHSGEQTIPLTPGEYRLIVLPQPVTARVVARFDAVPQPPRFEGHGPHPLPLGVTVEHLWREPDPGEPRTPDQWEIELPGPARVAIALDQDMRGELTPTDPAGERIAEVAAGRGFQGELAAGRYRLSLTQRRPNHRVPYTLSVTAEELLPGESRPLNQAGSLTLALGRDGLAEVYSVGGSDVQARLFDGADRLVAASDDRADDWNFHIARRLAPGRYRLEVSGSGAGPVETTVHLRTPLEVAEPALAPAPQHPLERELRGEGVHLFPLETPAGSNLLRIAMEADEAMGMILERREGDGWREAGQRTGRSARLELPIDPGAAPLRLRLWALDQRHGTARLRVEALDLPLIPESQLAAGVTPTAVEGGGIAAVRIERPGTFRLAAPSGVRAGGDGVLEPLAGAIEGAMVSASGGVLWLAADGPQAGPFRAERLRIGAEEVTLHLPAGQRATMEAAPGRGPLLAIARSRDGQPGLRLLGSGANAGIDADQHISVAATADAGPNPALALYHAATEVAPLRAALQLLRFDRPQGRPANLGVTPGELSPGNAQRLTLPGGPKRAVLALPPATAALFLRGDRVLSTHWSGDAGATEGLTTEADALLLLPAGKAKAGYRLELVPTPGARPDALRPGGLWRLAQPAAGITRLRVEAAGRLHTLGAGQVLFLADDGAVREGSSLTAPGPGTLRLRHGPGILAAWSESPTGAPADGAAKPATAVTPPATLPLQGRRQAIRLTPTAPALLHLSGDGPMIARWQQGGEDRVAIQPLGAALDLYAPAEGLGLTLHPLGEALSGQLRVTATPIEPVGEGMGPERLLPAGGAIAYGFTLDRPRRLGIGLHASADDLRGTLLERGGRRLGEGIVHYRDLPPGGYLLLAQVPEDAAPTRVAPVILGLAPGDSGPAPELIRRFVQAGPEVGMISDLPPPPPAPGPPQTDEGEEGEAVEAGGMEGETGEGSLNEP